jgi:tetratricopeptide (TPR) repeat protein
METVAMKRIGLVALVLAVFGLGLLSPYGPFEGVQLALAADTSNDKDDDKVTASSDWRDGNMAADAGDWAKAIGHFTKATAANPTDADAENMLGYSYRKSGDYDQALMHYTRALEINPKHKGAHEYIGEAYLELGDLAKAEEYLKRLDGICTFGCSEYKALKKAVRAYKKNLAS